MTPHAHEDDELRRYLLDSLTEEARDGVEQRLFSDDRIFWEHVREAEEALIDDYVWDELQGEEQERFERHFLLSPERRSRLEFARAFRVYARAELQKREKEKKRFWAWLQNPVPAPAWAMAAAAALLLVVLPGVVWQFAPRGPGREVSAWLSPGLVRSAGGELGRVRLPSGCQLVRLQLDPDLAQYETYQATLHEVAGDEIWSQSRLAATTTDGRIAVTLTLPCELLPPGDYYVRLRGVSPGKAPVVLNRYDFRVLRQD